MTVKYVGNCQPNIDCESLIAHLKTQEGHIHYGNISLPEDNPYYQDSLIQKQQAIDAGYRDPGNNSLEFRHYNGGEQFDFSIVEAFADLVKAKPLLCWISEIRPGKCAPWHWDINPWEKEHEKLGKLVRYHCHLSKPKPGHIFIVEDQVFYNQEQGSIYQWSDLHAYHAGSNVGLETKFLFTFTGYQ